MIYQKIQLFFIFLFSAIFIIRIIINKIKRVKIIQVYKIKKSAKQFLFEIIPLISFSLVIFISLNEIFSWEIGSFQIYKINIPEIIQIISIIFISLSFVVLILAYYQLGLNWKIGSGNETRTLIKNGIFNFSRNPIYLFFIVFSFGFFFINGLLPILGLSFIISASLHRVILQEEKNLNDNFKEEYLKYKKNVPRYILK